MTLPDPALHPECYEHVIGKRFLAWVVDLAITLGLMLGAIILSGFIALFVFPVVWFALAVAYRTFMLARYGATAGMMLAAVEWRGLDGSVPSQEYALAHSVIYALSMTFVVPQILSVVLMLNTPYRQGLNDWILRTTIINRFILS